MGSRSKPPRPLAFTTLGRIVWGRLHNPPPWTEDGQRFPVPPRLAIVQRSRRFRKSGRRSSP